VDKQVGPEINATYNPDTDEPVLYSTRRHWAVFLPPFLLLVIGGLSVPSKGLHAWILVGIALAWFVLTSIRFQTSDFRLSSIRMLITVRFPRQTTLSIPLSDIRAADVYQPALGKLLDFGRVRLIYTDGSKRYIRMVHSPLALAAKISSLKAALEERK
jgi:hypothetical protein